MNVLLGAAMVAWWLAMAALSLAWWAPSILLLLAAYGADRVRFQLTSLRIKILRALGRDEAARRVCERSLRRLCRATRAILAEVSLSPAGGTLRLRYDALPWAPAGVVAESIAIDETIAIVAQPQPFGGAPQRFMVCPFTGRRAKALFLPRGGTRFGCREAYGLVYASQRRSPTNRALAVVGRIRRSLGGSPSVLDPFPDRPRGMHQRRYDRLQARDQASAR